MDNLNDNPSSLKKELDAENKEWLAQLLSGADMPPEKDTPPAPENAAEEPVEPEVQPAEPEVLLTEPEVPSTESNEQPAEPEEQTVSEADAFLFPEIAAMAEPALDAEPALSDKDAELERILMEDWSNDIDIDAPTIQIPPIPAKSPESEIVIPDGFMPETEADPAPVEASTPEPEALTEDTEEEPEEEPEEVLPKIRPKRKSGYGLLGIPHILSTVIWLALIVAIGVSLGRTLWVCCADVMAFGKEAKSVTITITEDDDIDSIAKKLGNAGLVRYPGLFKFFADVTDKTDNIGVGTFTLNAQLDYNAMINAMYDYGPEREVVTLMFPEGYNCAQIFKLLEDNNVCTAAELEQYAIEGELKEYWFLEGVARGSKYCLEGYLAPDTYKFYVGDTPRRVLEKFLDEFNDRFTDIMKEDFEKIKKTYADRLKAKGFDAAYIQEHTLTVHQVVTLASVIQKETSSDGECYDIASTFYNRLVNPDIMTLGADATVYYALGDYFWEIEELTAEHLKVDSPYNTRLYKGIPPGPICNMGVHALYAALEPNDTKYHYFVYDPAKLVHRFAATYTEHLKNLKELGY